MPLGEISGFPEEKYELAAWAYAPWRLGSKTHFYLPLVFGSRAEIAKGTVEWREAPNLCSKMLSSAFLKERQERKSYTCV